MIISLGGRTDIAQYYGDWLMRRISDGYALVRNPFCSYRVSRYELDPQTVDCLVFCSKNYEPFMSRIDTIVRSFRTYFFYTITPYGRDVEPGVPSVRDSVKTLISLSKIVGRERLVWRFDPILITERYTLELVTEAFARMTPVIAPHVAKCIFSIVMPYRKLSRNMPEVIEPSERDVVWAARRMGRVAGEHGMILQSCACDVDLSEHGIRPPGCVTLEAIAQANGVRFRSLKHAGMRPRCKCISWHDIGAYDTCPNGCRYCYANSDPRTAAANHARHDVESPMLCDEPRDGDVITCARQRSFIDCRAERANRELF